MTQKHIGSSLDDLLLKDGTYENVTTAAVKCVLARQLGAAMAEQDVSKTDMARRMKTSRAQLNRLLDPNNAAVTLETLQRAAAAVGRQVRLELV